MSATRLWEDTFKSATLISPLIHQLLCFRPMDDLDSRSIAQSTSTVPEALRLGAMLFLAESRRMCGVCPVVVREQIRKLKTCLAYQHESWSGLLEWKIWVLVLGAFEASN